MKISSFKFYAYHLPLCKTSPIGPDRKGFFIHLKDDEGFSAYGEVAPLPKRSLESLEMISSALINIQTQIAQKCFIPFSLPPSVAFGLGSALDIFAIPMKKEKESFNYTCLCMGSREEIIAKASSTPCSQVKIKVGSLPLSETVSLLGCLLERKKRVILDFDQQWVISDILRLCQHFAPTDIDGLEDPVNSLEDIAMICKKTSFPIHLDALFTQHIQEIDKILTLGIRAIVIKPSLVGNRQHIMNIQRLASSHGVDVRLSSSFETSLGILHIVRLASLLDAEYPLGIDTLDIFEKSPFSLPCEDGRITITRDLLHNTPLLLDYLSLCKTK